MKELFLQRLRQFVCIVIVVSVSGCATTGIHDERDPFEGFNRHVYSFNETVNDVLFDHVGTVYRAITPDFVDKGVSNFFSNLGDISVIANDILQLKIGQAYLDSARFIFNSTLGLLGLRDVSTMMGLEKHDEDFGQTLAHWGVGSGPYLVVPLMGPATVRDATGFIVDRTVFSPIAYLESDELKAGLLTLNYVDVKSDLLSATNLIGDAALDEYEFIKNAYFDKRNSQINGSSLPPPDFE